MLNTQRDQTNADLKGGVNLKNLLVVQEVGHALGVQVVEGLWVASKERYVVQVGRVVDDPENAF